MPPNDKRRHVRRPLIFDATHLVARLSRVRTSGIDQVDFAYARHFSAWAPERGAASDAEDASVGDIVSVAHYGLRHPRIHNKHALVELLSRWHDIASDQGYSEAYRWLTTTERPRFGRPSEATSKLVPKFNSQRTHDLLATADRRSYQLKWILSLGTGDPPPDAIYLNVAQHLLEHRNYFSWLRQRRDVTAVFFVHDLIPLDWPEYFPAGYRERFERRWLTIQEFAGAIITSSESVRARLEQEYLRCDRAPVPIHVAPLPPPLDRRAVELDATLLSVPYFIVVGTIEPRKNHLLLLNIWRRMAETGVPPKLLVVGSRGWENEQILDVLDRSRLVRPHVLEMSNLGDLALARLIKNARAVLLPSFAEGYGLPLVEGLVLGTPVIASDIPVFREVGQNAAVYRHPLDGPGWRAEITRLASKSIRNVMAERSNVSQLFTPPTWPDYFENLEAFLQQLRPTSA